MAGRDTAGFTNAKAPVTLSILGQLITNNGTEFNVSANPVEMRADDTGHWQGEVNADCHSGF